MSSSRGVREASMYRTLSENKAQCMVCPRKCIIPEGKRGFCQTRENRGGKIYTLIYGEITALACDPIEKKPLFHFHPGSLTFSISTVGCSFKCPWCQNWEISQSKPGEIPTVHHEPESIVKLAKRYRCNSISYTYNEPIIWYEYVLDTAKEARKHGLLNVLVTNGYISTEALAELAPYIDAANVDVKSWTRHVYVEYCKAELEPVLEACQEMIKRGIHVELTYLVIPKINDDESLFKGFSKWALDHLGPDTPIHFSRFYPHYKMTHIPPTPIEKLEKARQIALDTGLHYVYVGNVPGHEGENTYCPSCKEPVITRYGFSITSHSITKDMKCAHCGEKIKIIGQITERKRWRWLFM
ncbi:MAG: AmmeMemoRadiSam system radical SAM enzyme [archaeon GB-1867-005]|nr:AmmeMemoRadiSam system radical SAM enzyme [Candidatus Culexmicrobium cathedralense]